MIWPKEFDTYRQPILFGLVAILVLMGFYAGSHLGYEAGYSYVKNYYIDSVNERPWIEIGNCDCTCQCDDTPNYKSPYYLPLEFIINISK